jgi:hypothetical protein
MAVRAGAAQGTVEARAFELARAEYDALANELLRQDQDAANKASRPQ